jgi:hypothetical protein
MPRSNSFRIGKVTGYLRGRVWYLSHFENGRRRRQDYTGFDCRD